MKNNLEALNNYLFEAIERLQDDELTGERLDKEIKKTKAVTEVAKVIVSNAELALKAAEFMNENTAEPIVTPVMLKG